MLGRDSSQFPDHLESEVILLFLVLQTGDFLLVGSHVVIAEFDDLLPYAGIAPTLLVFQEFPQSFRLQEPFMVIILGYRVLDLPHSACFRIVGAVDISQAHKEAFENPYLLHFAPSDPFHNFSTPLLPNQYTVNWFGVYIISRPNNSSAR